MVDANEITDTLAYVIALMLEYAPTIRTNKDMREASERVGAEVHRMLKKARAITEQSGQHPIEAFGAFNPMTGGLN